MSEKVIARKYMPSGFPLMTTMTAYLMLDHFGNNPIAIGIVGTLLVILWIVALCRVLSTDGVKPSEI